MNSRFSYQIIFYQINWCEEQMMHAIIRSTKKNSKTCMIRLLHLAVFHFSETSLMCAMCVCAAVVEWKWRWCYMWRAAKRRAALGVFLSRTAATYNSKCALCLGSGYGSKVLVISCYRFLGHLDESVLDLDETGLGTLSVPLACWIASWHHWILTIFLVDDILTTVFTLEWAATTATVLFRMTLGLITCDRMWLMFKKWWTSNTTGGGAKHKNCTPHFDSFLKPWQRLGNSSPDVSRRLRHRQGIRVWLTLPKLKRLSKLENMICHFFFFSHILP